MDIDKRIKDGRGRGRLQDYEPWLEVHDVPSRGKSTRIFGWTTGRVHHLLSRGEESYFYILDWSPLVIDIREQFPLLPLDDTLRIAQRLGFAHPRHPRTKELIVMTTDVVPTVASPQGSADQGRTFKPASELKKERTRQKLAIEREYWYERGVDWAVVTEVDIPAAFVENVKWVHAHRRLSEFSSLSEDNIAMIARTLTDMIRESSRPLSRVTADCDAELSLPIGTALAVARHLIATQQWMVDMHTLIDPAEPLRLMHTALAAGE